MYTQLIIMVFAVLTSAVTTTPDSDEPDSGSSSPLDCSEIMALGHTTNGVYKVYMGAMQLPVLVYCDMVTDGGGWTVFQRRVDGSEDFYRNWANYTAGFGNLRREFWLGNENLHWLLDTNQVYELRVDLADFNGNSRYAAYDNFRMNNFDNGKYKLLSLGAYTGNAGDSLSFQLGGSFSTYDMENDQYNCAVQYRGAWWYTICQKSNLNGHYYGGNYSSFGDGVVWSTWTGYQYSLKFTEMKFRPSL